MKKSEKTHPFVLGGTIAFHFCGDPCLPDLLKKLHPSAVAVPAKDSIALWCGSEARKMLKDQKWHFYKGIPWKGCVRYNDSGRIEAICFYGLIFRQFLFFRIVLLPLLWRLAVAGGGFYTLGTAYRDAVETTFLFAHPGAGKTRYALEKLLTPECTLIGDGSLLYLPEQGILSVIDEIELRNKTVSGLPFRKKLSWFRCLKLFLYDALSYLTSRKISFNLPLMTNALGLSPSNDNAARPHLCLIKQGNAEVLSATRCSKEITDYLADYHNHYDNIFEDAPPLGQSEKNILEFCKKYSILD